MYFQILQCFYGGVDIGQCWLFDVFDEYVLCGSCVVLYFVQYYYIGFGFYCQCGVVIGLCVVDFDIDWFFLIGDFVDFKDFDFQIVWVGLVGVMVGGMLVDVDGQVVYFGYVFGDFLVQQYVVVVGFCVLVDYDFDGVGVVQIVGVYVVMVGQILIDQFFGMVVFFIGYVVIVCGG